MATYYGNIVDANGNVYIPEVEAADVQMSDGSTAQDAITSIASHLSNLSTRIATMNANFDTILGPDEE